MGEDVPSVIVWDLETVPDVDGYAAVKGLLGKDDEQIREGMGDKFPKHICAWSCLQAVLQAL